MFCSNCGKELSEKDKFCAECGTPVAPINKEANEEVAQKHNTGDIASDYKVNDLPEQKVQEKEQKEDFHSVWDEEDSFKQEDKPKSLSFDWSSVIDEPRKKKAPEIKSPWNEPLEDEYAPPEAPKIPELNVDFGDPSKDRGRTLTFIDILKQEKEERKRNEDAKTFSDLIAMEKENAMAEGMSREETEDVLPSNELEKTQGYTDLKQDIIAELSKEEDKEKETPDFESQFDYIKKESAFTDIDNTDNEDNDLAKDIDLFDDFADLDEFDNFDNIELNDVADGTTLNETPEESYSEYEDSYAPKRRGRTSRLQDFNEAEEIEESAETDAADDSLVVESSSDIDVQDEIFESDDELKVEQFELDEPAEAEPSLDDEIAELERQLAILTGMKNQAETQDSEKSEEELIVENEQLGLEGADLDDEAYESLEDGESGESKEFEGTGEAIESQDAQANQGTEETTVLEKPAYEQEDKIESLFSSLDDFDLENIEDLSNFENVEQDDYDIDQVIEELGGLEMDEQETYGESSYGPSEKSEEELIEESEAKVEEFDELLKENPKADISQLVAPPKEKETETEAYEQVPIEEDKTESDKEIEEYVFGEDSLLDESSDTLEDDLLADGLFADEEEAEATKKIEKFYTLYRKNEEFQKLLDEEYRKLQGGLAQEELDELADTDDRFDVYADTSSVAALETETHKNSADKTPALNKEDEKAYAKEPEISKEDIKVDKKEEKKTKEDKSPKVAEAEEEQEQGSNALTVIAIVIAVLLVLLLVMILIMNFAPNSGIGKGLSNMLGNFTNLFGDANSTNGRLL